MDHKPGEPEGKQSLVSAKLAVLDETDPPRNGIGRHHQRGKTKTKDAGYRSLKKLL